jgi:hypothetical protein
MEVMSEVEFSKCSALTCPSKNLQGLGLNEQMKFEKGVVAYASIHCISNN